MMIEPAWRVKVFIEGESGRIEVFSVPESDLNAFLRVLVFNRRSFNVAGGGEDVAP